MRKQYDIQTTTNGVTQSEKTYYRVSREEEGKALLTTFVDTDDTAEVMQTLANDFEHDSLLEVYLGNGCYELQYITLKHKKDGILVYLVMKAL